MGLFDFLKSKSSGKETNNFSAIIEAALKEADNKNENSWYTKPNESEAFNTRILTLPHKEKVAFIVDSIVATHDFYRGNKVYGGPERSWQLQVLRTNFMQHLLKTKLVLDDEDVDIIASAFANYPYQDHNTHILYWPVNLLVNQIEKQLKTRPVSDKMKTALTLLEKKVGEEANYHQQKDQIKILSKISTMLFSAVGAVQPVFFPGDDEFGKYANKTIEAINEADRTNWFRLMTHSQKASGGKPSQKFLDEGKALFKEFGADKFKQIVNDWVVFITNLKESVRQHTGEFHGNPYNYTSTEFLYTANIDMIKGFIWMCVHFHDKTTLFNLAMLAERAYRKIPGTGPAAPSVGNACIYVLANSKGLDGVGHLSRLKLRIKQSNTQTLIDKYLQEAAEEQGVTIDEIEDMAIDDYELEYGKKEYEFDGYKAVLKITGVGKAELSWFKPDGTPQKSEPASIKKDHAAKLKKIKAAIKQIELTVSAQRDRLDRKFKSNRTMTWAQFNEFYFSHGLMSFLVHRLIWVFEKEGRKEAAFLLDNKWCNRKGEELTGIIDDSTTVTLWHPVFYNINEVSAWREFMMHHKIVQPLKQAFREVYLLTDAEINTVTYSNRMAAHILKQHQFNSLAKTRGWKYSLLGGYDNGIERQCATIDLREYSLRAEYWINEVAVDGAMNDTGIWLYVATDQVRFISIETNNVVDLIDVPRLVLSEIMRDVDLFVGVASVGNDPAWQDTGGLPIYRDYWQSYSFGDLSEVAKTRKSILEGMLPKLKISKVAELKDKYLIVKGKLRTYKIHIGSTNILMEPNDQYLCIVPDRGQKDVTGNLFLPFEGDTGLSVILSKAMLLADDDKITDPTITRQIKNS